MKTLRAAIAGILSLAAVTAAFAQSAPANLPYHTVFGRVGAAPGDTGPGQAIPFATLLTQMLAVPTSRTISTTAPLAGGGDLSANRTLSITGAAGKVLAGAAPAFTATPTLGVAGTTVGTFSFENATSGSITLTPPTGALGVRTLTLPIATDTLIAKATTDTLTNKTFDTAGTGNSFSINGVAATANTGTGAVARATSPVFVTPTLGAATATSINGNFFTAGTYTLAGTAGKTLTFSNSLTLAGTDATTLTFQGTDTYVGRATTDTLTNKTFNTQGTGNAFTLNGAAFGTATQATAALNAMVGDSGSGGTKGLVPAPGAGDAGAGKYLKADGTYAVPPGGTGLGATTKAAQQTGTDNATAVTPLHQQDHDSAEKAWVAIASCSTGTCTISAGYNVTSVLRSNTGVYVVNFTTPFATANYACQVGMYAGSGSRMSARGTTSIVVTTLDTSFGAFDAQFDLSCRGRQ